MDSFQISEFGSSKAQHKGKKFESAIKFCQEKDRINKSAVFDSF